MAHKTCNFMTATDLQVCKFPNFCIL